MATTFANLIQYAQDQTADQNDAKALRKQKRAINSAFRRIVRKHDWSFYIPKEGGRINFDAKYATGTLAITQGASAAVLTGGVFPTGAVAQKIVASSNVEVEFEVKTRTDNTNVIFVTGQVWLDDTVAASTYGIYKDIYDLPTNFRKFLEGKGETRYLNYLEPPAFRVYKQERRNTTDDPPIVFTVLDDKKVQVYPYPSVASVWEFLYHRSAAELVANEDAMDWDEDLIDVAYAAIDAELVIEFGADLLKKSVAEGLALFDLAAEGAWEDDSTRVRTFDTWGLEPGPGGRGKYDKWGRWGPRPLGLVTDE